MPKPPHVALLIETSRAYGRGLLRGVARYVREHGPWSVFFSPQGLDAPPPPWLPRWRGHGILARINSREMAQAVQRTKLPTVDLRNAIRGLRLPGIGPDNRAVAEMTFDHFRACGIRRFAFCGAARGENQFLDARSAYFCQLAQQSGQECPVFNLPAGHRAHTWEQEQTLLARWVAALPRPVGVMTCHDDCGQRVLDACLRAGLAVPHEVAVVGVDNDEHLCGLSNPPLSSVDVNPERIGYEAAALLKGLMKGAAPPSQIVEHPPQRLVVRQSSDVIGVSDPLVAAAMRVIRQRACEGIRVGELAGLLDTSASTLERRFAESLGRTPKQEILRVQLNAAKDLLSDTGLSIALIAQRVGFGSPHHFSDVFRRRTGYTPGAYRRL